MRSLFVLLFALLVLVGCAGTVSTKQMMRIQRGMTKQQVINLIGEPVKVGYREIRDGNEVESWGYWTGDGWTTRDPLGIFFVNGRVDMIRTVVPDQVPDSNRYDIKVH